MVAEWGESKTLAINSAVARNTAKLYERNTNTLKIICVSIYICEYIGAENRYIRFMCSGFCGRPSKLSVP